MSRTGPASKVPVRVDGRELTLSNLDKVLYPECGFTKAEVIDYYSRIAPVLLPHLAGRPLTVKRYPNGIGGMSFFEKNTPEHTPGWVRRVRLPVPGSTKDRDAIDFAVIGDLPALVYYANLAALELHVPQWRVDDDGRALPPDTLVFDLDPGPPATIVECCRVALMVRDGDQDVMEAVYRDFEPALPVTEEGILSSAIGFVAVWGGLLLLSGFIRSLWRRPRSRRAAAQA